MQYLLTKEELAKLKSPKEIEAETGEIKALTCEFVDATAKLMVKHKLICNASFIQEHAEQCRQFLTSLGYTLEDFKAWHDAKQNGNKTL